MVLRVFLSCFGAAAGGCAPSDHCSVGGPRAGPANEEAQERRANSNRPRTECESLTARVQPRVNSGREVQVCGRSLADAESAVTSDPGGTGPTFSCNNNLDATEGHLVYSRDHMVCSGMPSAVTIFSLRGFVLHQNPASVAYLGERLKSDQETDCRQDDEDVLACVFMFEPEKLDQMLTEVLADGIGRWRGIIRVPPSLTALGQSGPGPTTASQPSTLLVDTLSANTIKASTSLQAQGQSIYDEAESGETQRPSVRRRHLSAWFHSNLSKTALVAAGLRRAASAMDASSYTQLSATAAVVRDQSIAGAAIAVPPSAMSDSARSALFRTLTNSRNAIALAWKPVVQCRTTGVAVAGPALAGFEGLEPQPAGARLAAGAIGPEDERKSVSSSSAAAAAAAVAATAFPKGSASPTGHLTAANIASAGTTVTASSDGLGHTVPQTPAAHDTAACSPPLNTCISSLSSLAPHVRPWASSCFPPATDSQPPSTIESVLHVSDIHPQAEAVRPNCRTVGLGLDDIPEATAAAVTSTATAASGGEDGDEAAALANTATTGTVGNDACSSRRSWESCGNPLATSTFGLVLNRPMDGTVAPAFCTAAAAVAAAVMAAAAPPGDGSGSRAGSGSAQGCSRTMEVTPRRLSTSQRSSSFVRGLPRMNTAVVGRTSVAAPRLASAAGASLPSLQLGSRPPSISLGHSNSVHSRVLTFASSLRNAPTAAQLLAEGSRRGSFQMSSVSCLDSSSGTVDAIARLAALGRPTEHQATSPPAARAFLRSRPSVDVVQHVAKPYGVRPRSSATFARPDRQWLCGPAAGAVIQAAMTRRITGGDHGQQDSGRDGAYGACGPSGVGGAADNAAAADGVMAEGSKGAGTGGADAGGGGGGRGCDGGSVAGTDGKEREDRDGDAGPTAAAAAGGAAPKREVAWLGTLMGAASALGAGLQLYVLSEHGHVQSAGRSAAGSDTGAGTGGPARCGDWEAGQQQHLRQLGAAALQLHAKDAQDSHEAAAVAAGVAADAVCLQLDVQRDLSFSKAATPGGVRTSLIPEAPDRPSLSGSQPPQSQPQPQPRRPTLQSCALATYHLKQQHGLDQQQEPYPKQQQQQQQASLQPSDGGIPVQPSPQSALRDGASEGCECWHEVWATRAVDPVTGQEVIVVSQHDVTAKVVAERHLAMVMEAEHRLLEQLFPKHILTHITEEWIAEAERAVAVTAPSSPDDGGATVAAKQPSIASGCGTRGMGLQEEPQQPQPQHQPQEWRPVVRDCNALATCHPAVTLLFADIKGFTPMCEQVAPAAVMTMLNDLFSRFDSMLDKFGVFKVETIGDCYFVAGGLIHEDEDGMAAVRDVHSKGDPLHAERVFMFAKAMLAAARKVRMPTTGQRVQVRIGIHSGPVVSGVVGTRMPRFCLFGDTVNTTSRMESTGVPGAIHASAAAYALLRSEAWEPTGGIQVKGKGFMQTYLWRPLPGDEEDEGGALQARSSAATPAVVAAAVIKAGRLALVPSSGASQHGAGRCSLVTQVSQGPSTSSAYGRQKRAVLAGANSAHRPRGSAALSNATSPTGNSNAEADAKQSGDGSSKGLPSDELELDNSEQLIAMLLDHVD